MSNEKDGRKKGGKKALGGNMPIKCGCGESVDPKLLTEHRKLKHSGK